MTITTKPCRRCDTAPLDCFNAWAMAGTHCCEHCDHGVSLTDRGQAVVADVRAGMDLDAAITKHGTGGA